MLSFVRSWIFSQIYVFDTAFAASPKPFNISLYILCISLSRTAVLSLRFLLQSFVIFPNLCLTLPCHINIRAQRFALKAFSPQRASLYAPFCYLCGNKSETLGAFLFPLKPRKKRKPFHLLIFQAENCQLHESNVLNFSSLTNTYPSELYQPLSVYILELCSYHIHLKFCADCFSPPL